MWRILVAADGLVPQQRILPLLEDSELLPVELPANSGLGVRILSRPLALPPAGSLSGRILDRDTRAPLPGALVWPESDPGCWVWTDASGTFRLRLTAGPVESGLAAAALGHAPGFQPLQDGLPGAPALLALVPTASLQGTAVDERSRPLAEVELRISLLGGAPGEKEAHVARTAADGAFRAPGLRLGTSYLVTAVLPGYAPISMPVAIPKTRAAPEPGLRLVLGRGRTAFGQVVDEGGRPVPGARIELTSATAGRVVASAPDLGAEAPQQTRTGADGRFMLLHVPAGWFRLRIEADGFSDFERDGLQVPAGTARADLGRFPLQHGMVLQGWAGDEEGRPLAGAEVWIIPAAVHDWAGLYAKGPAAVTGADGSFALRDLPGEAGFGLDVCSAGYLPLSAIVREVNEEPFRAVLRRAARISGRVSAPDGAPVSTARIESWLAGEEPERNESVRPCRRGSGSATTDAEGRFRLDGLPPGWWSLRATAGGHRGETRERLHVLAGESREDVEIVLTSGATVSGRVLTSAGEPAAGARVSALSEKGAVETVAGGDGAYRLAGVETGEHTVEATLDEGRWASRNLTVQPGDNRLDLKMDQGAPRREIRGRVLGPAGPVAGAAVLAAGSARTFSAADGSFLLAVEDNRDYEVWAEKEGFAAAKAGAAVHVAGAPVEGVEIRLNRGGTISGRLLGLDREELARASVEIELMPPFLARAAVDSRGSYRVEDVPPGEWTVTARTGDRVVREPAVLPPDASETAVDLAFAPSQEVSGWVSGPAGEPVAGAYLRFFAPGAMTGSTYSLSDGTFRLRLEDGTYRVAAHREGYLWTLRKEPLAVGGSPVSGLEVHLEEAGVIRGLILGLAPGERAKAVWASTAAPNGGRREGQLDQEGGFVIPDVPAGDWTVTVAACGREVRVPLHLDPGHEEEWVQVELGTGACPLDDAHFAGGPQPERSVQ